MENHTSESMKATVDFYYNLGALVHIYGHSPSQSDNLQGEFVTYCASKGPRMWSANAMEIYDWWQARSSTVITPTYLISGNTITAQAAVTGAADPDTAVEMALLNQSNQGVGNIKVFIDGSPADPADYRTIGNVIRIKVGNLASSAKVQYTFNNAVPTTTSLSPVLYKAGGTAFTLTVNGTGFVSGSVVRWNGADRTTAYVSSTQLMAEITATDVAAQGTALVSVSNPAPGGGTSSTQAFTVDGTLPVVTGFIATTPTATLNIPITIFTATDNIGVAGYQVTTSAAKPSADAIGWAGAPPSTYTVANDGTYTLYPWAKDTVGNVSAVFGTPRTVVVDTTPPDAPVVSGTTPTNNTRPTWTWTTGGGGSGSYRCKLDDNDLTTGATTTIGTSYRPASAQTEGSHTLYVQERDVVGNWSVSGSFTIEIDTTAPDTSITAQPANPTNQTIASFSFTATEAGSTFQCQIDGNGYSPCVSTATYTSLVGDQTHTFSVRAVDLAGNIDASPATYSWMIDTTAPDTNITAQPGNPTNQTTASFSFTATEAGSTFQCQLDGGAYLLCVSGATYSNLVSNQTHTFNVRAVDQVGNIDASPATFSWVIDTTAPGAPIVSGTTPTKDTTPMWTWTTGGGGGNGTYRYKLDDNNLASGATTTTGTSYRPALAQTEGSHALYVQEQDAAGNWSVSGSFAIVIDITAPDTSIVAHPANPTNQTAATFSFTATEAGSTFQCQIDGGGYSPCVSTATYSSLVGDQTHTFSVRAVDQAGNIDASPATFSWLIDTTAPGAPAVWGTTPTNNTTPTWGWTSSNGSSTYRYRLDNSDLTTGATPTTGTSYRPASALTEGPHTLYVQERDDVGNWSVSGSFVITIDTTAPTLVISAPSLSVANNGVSVTYTLTYTGADAVTCAAGQVTLNKTGSANGLVADTGTGATTRTVTISHITGFDGMLGISIAAGTASDLAGNTAVGTGPSATFTVDNSSGDFNGDGVVDMVDALKALRITAGLDVPTGQDSAHGDVAPLVNGRPQPDGKVDMGDVVVILRKAAGLPSW